jgi:SAM-dependent methyltransferase
VIERADVPVPFTSERLQRLQEIEENHFWFVGRRRLIDSLIAAFVPRGAAVLDIGVGGGLQSRRMQQRGFAVTAMDFLPEGLRALSGSGVHCVRCAAESLPFAPASFDAILALDVLEHTDDATAAPELFRTLRPGGILIMTVPALPQLWSVRDDLAGHRRRYRRRGVRALLAGVGLDVLRIGYYQCLLLPMVALTRVLGRERVSVRDIEDVPPRFLNTALRGVNSFEVALGRIVRWPIGSSLFAIARKPPGAMTDA